MIPMPRLDEMKSAFAAACDPDAAPSPITEVLPRLIADNNNDDACDMVSRLTKNSSWLPEALVLFNITGMNNVQKKSMVESVFHDLDHSDENLIEGLFDCNGRIGRYGFSFPQWRFVTQGFSGSSLIEHFGLTKLNRPTDVRDTNLPKSNPDCDQYGTGFLLHDDEWTLEYRRAYILCSNHSYENQSTLIVRNNSYFFGRDRLSHPVYVSWQPHSLQELQNLDEDMLSGDAFNSWQNSFTNNRTISVTEKTRRIQNLLNHMDQTDRKFSSWLCSRDGAEPLAEFIRQTIARQAVDGKTAPPFYLAGINKQMPPWFPQTSIPVTTSLLGELEAYADTGALKNPDLIRIFQSAELKMVLLSGAHGDLPLKHVIKMEVAKANDPSP